MTSLLDWRILEALDDEAWVRGFHARLPGWPVSTVCWEWAGAIDDRGFGRVRLPHRIGGTALPHRVTWLHRHGQVHPGLVLHPTKEGCVGRRCANPECWSEQPAGVRPGQKEPKVKLVTGQRRAAMPNLNAQILRAALERPVWLTSVYDRLDGYPEPGACWLWTGGKHERGYGRVRLPNFVGGQIAATHRVAWIAQRGLIPDGWVLDHDGDGCGNRSCANPDHVTCVPERINCHTGDSQWGINSRKTHCPRGHELAGDNLVPYSLARGERTCRICAKHRAQMRREPR